MKKEPRLGKPGEEIFVVLRKQPYPS